jgi:hypothetical protein
MLKSKEDERRESRQKRKKIWQVEEGRRKGKRGTLIGKYCTCRRKKKLLEKPESTWEGERESTG